MNDISALSTKDSVALNRTKFALLSTGILNEPLLMLYNLAAFILHKDLGATAWHIAILTMLRPLTSLLSLYWSSSVFFKPERAVSNVIWAGILSRLMFFLFPWLNSPGWFIAGIVFYMMLYRGATPAWLEILKTHLPDGKRERNFSLSSILAYTEGILLGIAFGQMLDVFPGSWRWLFALCATIGLIGVFFQARIPRLPTVACERSFPNAKTLMQHLTTPWKEAWNLLRSQPSFARFQWAMMLFGIGIMIIQPALPFFFIDTLKLSYTDLAVAFAVCRGLGFAISSTLWAKALTRRTLYPVTSAIFVLMAAFPLCLLCAQWHVWALYLGYTIYGIAQAGIHLSWNLSGPLFAEQNNSTLYSSVNVVSIGIRGCFVPILGSGLCTLFGPIFVLGCGVFFAALAALKMGQYGLNEKRAIGASGD